MRIRALLLAMALVPLGDLQAGQADPLQSVMWETTTRAC